MTPSDEATVLLTDIDPGAEPTLLVIPAEIARKELRTYATLLHACTFGEARRDADAAALIRDGMESWAEGHLSLDDDDDWADLLATGPGDDEPFGAEEFFGEDSWRLWMPVASLTSAQCIAAVAPELAQRFFHEDSGWGVDYEPAPWLKPDDRDAIEAALTEQGFVVQPCNELARQYGRPDANLVDRIDDEDFP